VGFSFKKMTKQMSRMESRLACICNLAGIRHLLKRHSVFFVLASGNWSITIRRMPSYWTISEVLDGEQLLYKKNLTDSKVIDEFSRVTKDFLY
jgi:hypothetical protein